MLAIDAVKAKAIEDELAMMLLELAGINRVHRGDPRGDLEVPAAILEFDFPDKDPLAFGIGGDFRETGRNNYDWTWSVTFAFDARYPAKANEQWLYLAVEVVNMVEEYRQLGPYGLWRDLRVENVLPPETIVNQDRGNPPMFKAVRLIAQSEER